jgi:hypothetical protein
MSGLSFTFRCGECNRLLGVSRSRIGTTVTCPKCGTDLVVPDPDDDTAEAPPPPASTSGETAAVGVTAAGGAAVFPGLAIEPEPLSLRSHEPRRPYKVPDRRTAPASEPEPDRPTGSSGSGFVGIQVEEVPIRETGGPTTAPEVRLGTRPGDVVMPRTAFLLWSFVMLAALVLTFSAGLLAGHFLWRG